MKVMTHMHSLNVFVALLNFLFFEVNNVKYNNSSYVISKVSFSSEVMWRKVNFLGDS